MIVITSINKDILAVEGNCSKDEFFQEIARYLGDKKVVDSPELLVQELLDREKVRSTLVEQGIAMPHVESLNVRKSTVLFVRIEKAVRRWEDDSEPVSLAVCLLLKENENRDIKDEVVGIVRMFGDEDFVEQIRNSDYQEFKKIFNESL